MIGNSKLVVVFLLVCAAFGSLRAAEGDLPSNLHWWVVQHTENGQKADFFIVLKEQADVSHARELAEKADKGSYVFSALTRTADATQAPLRSWLDSEGVRYRPLWIVNAILVEGGDRKLALEAARRPDVDRVEGNPVIHNVFPKPGKIGDVGDSQASAAPQAVEWNIAKVNAPGVWALGFRGDGIVVGGQDTGYRWTHTALKSRYRGWNGTAADHDYNWHDSIHTTGSSCGADSPVPCDDYGHGTHTMGTVLGDDGASNQVGMAPQAKWIGCRNMDSGNGTPATYLECFQFFLAPTKVDGSNPDPTKAPDVTNNSWGCPTSEGCSWDTLQMAVNNQEAAGIMTVASAGNSGSSCNTVTDPPAIYLSAYTVGSTTSSDSISFFSSRGYATGTNAMKPNIVAPGSGVRSAYNSSDTAYTTMDGTSMAGPHVAGAVALLWSARSCFLNQQDATETVLNGTALDLPGIVESCGGNYTTGPNNTWGNGRLDILAAVNAGCPCTTPGTPTIGSATIPGDNQITVSWTPGSPAGSTYKIYRSTGACPGGTFKTIGSGQASSPWTDATVSGGTTYAYKVAAVDSTGGCESAPSGCVSATATGACTLAPTFAGLASVTNPAQETCTLNLSWAAATANCSGPVRYRIYRSATTPVQLIPENLLASEVDATSYSDGSNLASGTTYHYVVRSVDLSNGVEDSNNVEGSAAPTGAVSAQTLNETFEGPGGFDLAGWTYSILSGSLNWAWSTAQADTPTHSWYAQDGSSVGDKVLVSPAFGVLANTTVTFRHRYTFEGTSSCYDGGTLEYALGPGFGTWTVAPDAWFAANGFNGTVSSSYSNPIAGKRAWCFSLANWTQVSLGLSTLSGQSVKLRWHEGDDTSVASTGWYVDSVTISDAGTAAACTTGAGCTVPGAPCDDGNACTQTDTCQSGVCSGVPVPAPSEVDDGVRVDRAGPGAVVRWRVASGATSSDLLRGSLGALPVGPGGGDETCLGDDLVVADFTDSDMPPAPAGFWYLVRGANACGGNGPYGFEGSRGAPGAARASTTCP